MFFSYITQCLWKRPWLCASNSISCINKNKHFYPLLALSPQINLINLQFFLAYVFIEIQSEDEKSQTDRQCRHCLGECVCACVCLRLSALSVSQSVSQSLTLTEENGGLLEGGTVNQQTSGTKFRSLLPLTFRLFMCCVFCFFLHTTCTDVALCQRDAGHKSLT